MYFSNDIELDTTYFEMTVKNAFSYIQENFEFYCGCDDVFLEKSGQDKRKKFIGILLDKVSNIFKAAKDKIINMVNERRVKTTVSKYEELVKEHPELANEKITIPDNEKLVKLGEETMQELGKPNCDVEKTIQKYKKQRNVLLGISAGITVTLGAAIAIITCRDKKTINKLNEAHETAVKTIRQQDQIINTDKEKLSEAGSVIKGMQRHLKKIHKENGELKEQLSAKPGAQRTAVKARQKLSHAADAVDDVTDRAASIGRNTKKRMEAIVVTGAEIASDVMTSSAQTASGVRRSVGEARKFLHNPAKYIVNKSVDKAKSVVTGKESGKKKKSKTDVDSSVTSVAVQKEIASLEKTIGVLEKLIQNGKATVTDKSGKTEWTVAKYCVAHKCKVEDLPKRLEDFKKKLADLKSA